MSNLISALNHEQADGFATVQETGLHGMITVRGDLGSKEMKAAVKVATGAKMPAQRKIEQGKSGAAAWMSPDELLIIVTYEGVAAAMDALNSALDGQHAMVVNVSDARAVFRISGDAAAEVIGKIAPVDLSADRFEVGDFRRSRVAQVAAAFWKNDDDSFDLVCFRSSARYVFDLLRVSAEEGGQINHYC